MHACAFGQYTCNEDITIKLPAWEYLLIHCLPVSYHWINFCKAVSIQPHTTSTITIESLLFGDTNGLGINIMVLFFHLHITRIESLTRIRTIGFCIYCIQLLYPVNTTSLGTTILHPSRDQHILSIIFILAPTFLLTSIF